MKTDDKRDKNVTLTVSQENQLKDFNRIKTKLQVRFKPFMKLLFLLAKISVMDSYPNDYRSSRVLSKR